LFGGIKADVPEFFICLCIDISILKQRKDNGHPMATVYFFVSVAAYYSALDANMHLNGYGHHIPEPPNIKNT
jgi:hypothetical protein